MRDKSDKPIEVADVVLVDVQPRVPVNNQLSEPRHLTRVLTAIAPTGPHDSLYPSD